MQPGLPPLAWPRLHALCAPLPALPRLAVREPSNSLSLGLAKRMTYLQLRARMVGHL